MNYMYEKLKPHIGHEIVCVEYKHPYTNEWNDPADICIECETCGEVIISAEDYM